MAQRTHGHFPSAAVYNSLPHIHEVINVPSQDHEDLDYLRALLAKHNTPQSISVRLVHKHFHLHDGEVMVNRTLELPTLGTVRILRPALPTKDLQPVHFHVDADGRLQAYEYAPLSHPDASRYPDLSTMPAFVEKFSRAVRERGLYRKFGLKLRTTAQGAKWHEYEFPEERSTIMVQPGMPRPDGTEAHKAVLTEYHGSPAGAREDGDECMHSCCAMEVCEHDMDASVRHGNVVEEERKRMEGLWFAGRKLEPGTPFHSLVNAIVEAW